MLGAGRVPFVVACGVTPTVAGKLAAMPDSVLRLTNATTVDFAGELIAEDGDDVFVAGVPLAPPFATIAGAATTAVFTL